MRLLSFILLLAPAAFAATEVAPEPKWPKFDERVLLDMAENQGYGYKFANLVELEKLARWFNQYAEAPLFIKIPEFFGISSHWILKELLNNGFDARQEWEKVIATILPQDREKVLQTKFLPSKFWQQQKDFLRNLDTAFDGMIKRIKDISFGEIANRKDADRLIEYAAMAKDPFMVRSTGKEDTRLMANAGGNKSVANVPPDKLAIWLAAKEVVLSYFGEKSLKQRLGLGDKSLFSPEVFSPVLVQRMVGERDVKKIPVCGVMFTEEPEAGLSWMEEKDRSGKIKTTGITAIQAAYGHNEGVVNSQVVVDTVIAQNLLDHKDPIFYPVIRAKRERLVPVRGTTNLSMQKNPTLLIMAPALDSNMVKTLKMFADALENYYGYPMDVEFVIRKNVLNNNIINIVQARPIVHNKDRSMPSYLPKLKDLPAEVVFKGQTIGAAGGAVVPIENKNEAIIMPTINAALSAYQKHPQSDSIKAIIIGTNAPTTSHEATTFRSEGKPVIFIRDFEKLAEAFDIDKNLILSPQQHSVVVLTKGEGIVIKDGWYAYPLPSELSISEALFLNADRVNLSLNQTSKFMPWSWFLERIRTGKTSQEVAEDTNQLQVQLDHEIKRISSQVRKDEDLNKTISDVQNAVAIISQRIVSTANIQENDPLYVTRLLPIVYLEALMNQQISNDEVFNPLSKTTLLNKILQPEAKNPFNPFMPAFGSLDSEKYYIQFNKITKNIFDQRTSNAWVWFTKKIAQEADPTLAGKLGLLIAQLSEFDLLPTWLHTTMVKDIERFLKTSQGLQTEELIKNWIQPLVASKDFLEQIKLLRQRIASFPINNFDDPEKFNLTWNQFNQTLFYDIKSANFKQQFNNANQMTRLATSFMFNQFIDLFDRSIKVVKGSPSYKLEEKLARFQEMLIAYNDWMRYFFENLVPDGAINFPGSSSFEKYLEKTTYLVNDNFTEKDLLPTPNVEVFNFSIGSGHDFVNDRAHNKQPASGEDAFSIIHQSLLNGCSALSVSSGLSDIIRPPLLSKIEEIFNKRQNMYDTDIEKPKIIGIDMRSDRMTVIYNQPLNAHSCQITLQYKHRAKSVQVELRFAGGLPWERHRWYTGAAFTVLMSASDEYKSLEPRVTKLNDHALVATFTVKNDKDYLQLENIWQALFEIAFSKSLDDIIKYTPNGPFNLEVAKKFLQFDMSGDWAMLVFFNALIKKHYEPAFEKATIIADQMATNILSMAPKHLSDKQEIYLGPIIGLLTSLIEVNYQPAYSKAEIIAKKLLNLTNYKDFKLVEVLVSNDHFYQEAMEAVVRILSDSIPKIEKAFAKKLLIILINKGYLYREATRFATDMITDPKIHIVRRRVEAIPIFQALIAKGQARSEIENIIFENKNIDEKIRSALREIIQEKPEEIKK